GATNTNKATLDQRSGEVVANANAADDTDIGIAQARNDITRGEADGKITVWAAAPEIAQNKVKSGTGDYDIEATTTTWRDKREWNQANGGGGGEQALNNDIDRGAGDGTVDVIANGKYRADNRIKRDTGDGLVISDAVASAKDGGVARNTLDRSTGDGVVDLYAEGSKRAGNFVKRADGDGETALQAYAAGPDGRATNELERGAGSGNVNVTTRGTAAVVNKIKTDDGFDGQVVIVGGSTNNNDAPAVVNDIDHKGGGDIQVQAGGRGAYNKITSKNAQGGNIVAEAHGIEFAGNDYLIDDSVGGVFGQAIAVDGNAVERSSTSDDGNAGIMAVPGGDGPGVAAASRMTILKVPGDGDIAVGATSASDLIGSAASGMASAEGVDDARMAPADAGGGKLAPIDRGAWSFAKIAGWAYEEHVAKAGEWRDVRFQTWSFTFARNYLVR
ncbi:MAG TPA: hypothetical protein VFF43_03675, partial [Caldimonas sp.]|nr:hypothetical protein [Caldimonas sp.]